MFDLSRIFKKSKKFALPDTLLKSKTTVCSNKNQIRLRSSNAGHAWLTWLMALRLIELALCHRAVGSGVGRGWRGDSPHPDFCRNRIETASLNVLQCTDSPPQQIFISAAGPVSKQNSFYRVS